MAIKSTCSSCGGSFHAPDNAGQNILCPQCKEKPVSVELDFADDLDLPNHTSSPENHDDLEIDDDIKMPDDLDMDDIKMPEEIQSDDIKIPDDMDMDMDMDTGGDSQKKVDSESGVSLDPIVAQKKANPNLPILLGVLVLIGVCYLLFVRDSGPKITTTADIINLLPEETKGVLVSNIEQIKSYMGRKQVDDILKNFPKSMRLHSQNVEEAFVYFAGDIQHNSQGIFFKGEFPVESFAEYKETRPNLFCEEHRGYAIFKENMNKQGDVYFVLLNNDLIFTSQNIANVKDVVSLYSDPLEIERNLDTEFLVSGTNTIPFALKLHSQWTGSFLEDIPQMKDVPRQFESFLSPLYKISFETALNQENGYLYLKLGFTSPGITTDLYDLLIKEKKELKDHVAAFKSAKIRDLADLLDAVEVTTGSDELIFNCKLNTDTLNQIKWFLEQGIPILHEEMIWHQNQIFEDARAEIDWLNGYLQQFSEPLYKEEAEKKINELKSRIATEEISIVYQKFVDQTLPEKPLENWLVWKNFPIKEYKGFQIEKTVLSHIEEEKNNIIQRAKDFIVLMKVMIKDNSYHLMNEEFDKKYSFLLDKDNQKKMDSIFNIRGNPTLAIIPRTIATSYRDVLVKRKAYEQKMSKEKEKQWQKLDQEIKGFFARDYYGYIAQRDYAKVFSKIKEYREELNKLEKKEWDDKFSQATQNIKDMKILSKVMFKAMKDAQKNNSTVTVELVSGKLRQGNVIKVYKELFFLKTYVEVEKIRYSEIKALSLWKILEKKYLNSAQKMYAIGLLLYSDYTENDRGSEKRLAERALQKAYDDGIQKAQELLGLIKNK